MEESNCEGTKVKDAFKDRWNFLRGGLLRESD